MGKSIACGKPLADEVRRLAGERLHAAARELKAAPSRDRIHKARVHLKRARAILLAAYSKKTDSLQRKVRKISHTLEGPREADALLETVARLQKNAIAGPAADALESLRLGLLELQAQSAPDQPQQSKIAGKAQRKLLKLAARVEHLEFSDRGFKAVATGIERTYRRARKRRPASGEVTPESLHKWRISVKRHMYHLELLKPALPRPMQARIKRLDALQETLGDHHDLSKLWEKIAADAGRFGAAEELVRIREFIIARQLELQLTALEHADLFDDPPSEATEELSEHYHKWQKRTPRARSTRKPRASEPDSPA